jgi:hypothetical protein
MSKNLLFSSAVLFWHEMDIFYKMEKFEDDSNNVWFSLL